MVTHAHCHTYGGLRIATDLDLVFLDEEPTDAPVDVVIEKRPFVEMDALWDATGIGDTRDIHVADDGSILARSATMGVTRFDPATGVLAVGFAPGIEGKGQPHAVLDWAIPYVLAYRGYTVLHATCTVIGDRSVGFVGGSGLGKSTLVAAFSARGHALVADDALILDVGDGAVTAIPSYPVNRLWADSANALLDADEPAGNKVSIGGSKVPFHREPVPLHGLLLPARGDEIAITPVPPAECTTLLFEQCFTLPGRRLAQALDDTAAVVESVAIGRLSYPRDFAKIDDVVATIIDWVS